MSAISIYDPFADVFPVLFGNVNREAAYQRARAPSSFRVDVKENAEAYVLQADLPGVAKDQIAVEVDGNQVTIRTETKRETEQKDDARVLRSERYVGQFARSFSLGSDIDDSKAAAKYDNGVLELTLPKKAAPAAKRLAIA